MLSKVNKFSLFKRLFIVYLLTVITIYVVMVALFLNNINRSSNELVAATRTQIQVYLSNIEEQLDSIHEQQVNLVNSDSVRRLAYSIYDDNYDRTQLILELVRSIEKIQAMNSLIEDIIIAFPEQEIKISSMNSFVRTDEDLWKISGLSSEFSFMLTENDRITLNLSYPLTFSLSEDYIPDYNIRVFLSETAIAESLNAFGAERGSGAAVWFRTQPEEIIENDFGSVVSEAVNVLKQFHLDAPEGVVSDIGDYQFILADSEKYPLTAVAYINSQLITNIKAKYISILTVLMVLISSTFMFSLVFTKRMVIKPLREMMTAFERIQNGDFSVRIYHEPHDEFNYLYHGFNNAVTYIQELIDNIYEQENLIQNAELAQLQSQINPHFLYNSFFIINRMAKNEDYDQITRFVTSLAKYYRFINKESRNYIPLYEEVNHMENYIAVQQMRFEDKIEVSLAPVPQELESVYVPKLILQPVIENAYNYGLANVLKDGLISVSYLLKGSIIRIIIEDNGVDADSGLVEKMSKGLEQDINNNENHALANINRRLSLIYGSHCGVSIGIGVLGGIKVTITIDSSVELT